MNTCATCCKIALTVKRMDVMLTRLRYDGRFVESGKEIDKVLVNEISLKG